MNVKIPFTTLVTNMRFQTRVNKQVFLQSAFVLKAFVTVRTKVFLKRKIIPP